MATAATVDYSATVIQTTGQWRRQLGAAAAADSKEQIKYGDAMQGGKTVDKENSSS